MCKWACGSTNLTAKIPNSSKAVQHMRTKQWPASFLPICWICDKSGLCIYREGIKLLEYLDVLIQLWNCLTCVTAERKKTYKTKAHFKSFALFYSKTTEALKVSSTLGQSRSEFICCVHEPHLNPVWMKVNTFTMVTIVWAGTQLKLGPQGTVCAAHAM